MSGGGKGGRSTTSVEIPEWLEVPARRNIAKAEEIARIGYVPYYGPDVAAMTPMQIAAGGNINQAASAFGLGAPTSATAGMPEAMNYGGMGAYSSAPLYEQSLAQLQYRAPAQYAALRAPFINPVTGAQPLDPFNSSYDPSAPAAAPVVVSSSGNDNGGGGFTDQRVSGGGVFNTHQGPNLDGSAGYGAGGYTSLGDMFDGGGPGRSGDTFSGGGVVSSVGNALGGPRGRDSNSDNGSSGMGGGK